MLTYCATQDTKSAVYQDSLQLRKEVFIQEQGVSPEIEIDEKEDSCMHIVGYTETGKPAATGRLYPLSPDTCKVQRVAVAKEMRGNHYGKELMNKLEEIALENNFSKIILGAQNQALPFYKKMGYQVISEEYAEAGILHHDVEKIFKKV